VSGAAARSDRPPTTAARRCRGERAPRLARRRADDRRAGRSAGPGRSAGSALGLELRSRPRRPARVLPASSPLSSPSWHSMARRVLPVRLELNNREGSSRDAPFANVASRRPSTSCRCRSCRRGATPGREASGHAAGGRDAARTKRVRLTPGRGALARRARRSPLRAERRPESATRKGVWQALSRRRLPGALQRRGQTTAPGAHSSRAAPDARPGRPQNDHEPPTGRLGC
jgi:hypothetical protein